MYRLSQWVRRERLTLILLLLVIALSLNCLLAPHGARDLMALRRSRLALENQIERQQALNSELQVKIGKLKGDVPYLERLVREHLGYVRPNELIYRFPPATGGRQDSQ